MIRVAPKYQEPFIAPPDPLKLLVEALYSGRKTTGSDRSSSSKESEDAPKGLYGETSSWMMYGEYLKMQRQGIVKKYATEAQKIQDMGGDWIGYLNTKVGDMQKEIADIERKEILRKAYKPTLEQKKTDLNQLSDKIENDEINASDYVASDSGFGYRTYQDVLPADVLSEVPTKLWGEPITYRDYLNYSDITDLNISEDGVISSNISTVSAPNIKGLFDLYNTRMSTSGDITADLTKTGSTTINYPGVPQSPTIIEGSKGEMTPVGYTEMTPSTTTSTTVQQGSNLLDLENKYKSFLYEVESTSDMRRAFYHLYTNYLNNTKSKHSDETYEQFKADFQQQRLPLFLHINNDITTSTSNTYTYAEKSPYEGMSEADRTRLVDLSLTGWRRGAVDIDATTENVQNKVAQDDLKSLNALITVINTGKNNNQDIRQSVKSYIESSKEGSAERRKRVAEVNFILRNRPEYVENADRIALEEGVGTFAYIIRELKEAGTNFLNMNKPFDPNANMPYLSENDLIKAEYQVRIDNILMRTIGSEELATKTNMFSPRYVQLRGGHVVDFRRTGETGESQVKLLVPTANRVSYDFIAGFPNNPLEFKKEGPTTDPMEDKLDGYFLITGDDLKKIPITSEGKTKTYYEILKETDLLDQMYDEKGNPASKINVDATHYLVPFTILANELMGAVDIKAIIEKNKQDLLIKQSLEKK